MIGFVSTLALNGSRLSSGLDLSNAHQPIVQQGRSVQASNPRRRSGVQRKVDLLPIAKRCVVREQHDKLVFGESKANTALVEFRLGACAADQFIAMKSNPMPSMFLQ
jgi:hypothetical protein